MSKDNVTKVDFGESSEPDAAITMADIHVQELDGKVILNREDMFRLAILSDIFNAMTDEEFSDIIKRLTDKKVPEEDDEREHEFLRTTMWIMEAKLLIQNVTEKLLPDDFDLAGLANLPDDLKQAYISWSDHLDDYANQLQEAKKTGAKDIGVYLDGGELHD